MKQLFTIGILLLFIPAIAQTGKVGIGTLTPLAQLHTTGTVRFDTLKSTGIRAVYANDSGNLITRNITSSTNTTPQNIPDASCTGVTSFITVSGLPAPVPTSGIQVKINITHPVDADVNVYLFSPVGQILNLAYFNGGGGQNFVNTVFSDGATQYLTASVAPFTGIFKPTGTLSPDCITPVISSFGALSGGSIIPNGTWTLRVFDNTSADVGTLNNWSISFGDLTQNFVVKNSSSGAFSNSSIFDNGNIGIGTTSPVSKLDVHGSMALSIKTVTGTYSLSANDYTIIASATGTITLPNANGISGRIYVIRRTAGTITINSSGGSIVGLTSLTGAAGSNCVTYQSDGNAWYSLSQF